MNEQETKQYQEMELLRAQFNVWWWDYKIPENFHDIITVKQKILLRRTAWEAWKSAHDFKKAILTAKGIEAQ